MQIRYTRLAVSDLSKAYDYIEADSPQNAREVIRRIGKSIETIATYPLLGKQGRVAKTREFFVTGTPYIIIYRVKEDVLQILSILHTSRKYP
ncbi:MAG: type II toxin-antitoxin system RelE/ParE family toxin [Synergistaceae bacterium]|nr:type II toxin-antitoxin system RelE/ParE family toxin [Synergistaceae bacterium]